MSPGLGPRGLTRHDDDSGRARMSGSRAADRTRGPNALLPCPHSGHEKRAALNAETELLHAARCESWHVSKDAGEAPEKEAARALGPGFPWQATTKTRPTFHSVWTTHRAAENSYRPHNDIEFSGERKRVRCNEGLGTAAINLNNGPVVTPLRRELLRIEAPLPVFGAVHRVSHARSTDVALRGDPVTR